VARAAASEVPMRCHLLLALPAVVVLTAFAPAPFPRPSKSDLKALQGSWTVVTIEQGPGRKVARVPPSSLKACVEGATWTFQRYGQPHAAPYTIVLDAAKNPKWIDIKRKADDVAAIVGIYTIEGDTLKILYALGRGSRPMTLGAPVGQQGLITLRRDNP
jgi:uncharacterized protein (TIGR03067 family)